MTNPRLLILPTFFFATYFSATPGRSEGPLTVGLQLWSLREEFRKDVLHALDLTKQMGFTEVETAGTAGMAAADYRAALEARGLTAVAAHVQYPAMEKDINAVVAEVKALGAKFAFCPWIPHESGFDAALVKQSAENFNRWGAAFRAAGIRFGYHTHGYEFVPGTNKGESLFDELVRQTRAEDVCLQMDVFWVYRAAADPVALLEKYPDRWVSLHIKDLRKGADRTPGSSGAPPSDKVVVGTGAVDWVKVLGTAKAQGIGHFVLEDESDVPLEQIPQSMDYLRSLRL